MDSQVQLHSFIPEFSAPSYQSNTEGKGNGCCPQSERLAIYSSIVLKNFPCFSRAHFPGAAVFQEKGSLAWVLLRGLQLPLGPVHMLQHGLAHGLLCGSLLHGPPQAAGAQLSHHGLLYGLQGNLGVKRIFLKCVFRKIHFLENQWHRSKPERPGSFLRCLPWPINIQKTIPQFWGKPALSSWKGSPFLRSE